MIPQSQPTRFNALQLELLRIFAHNPDEQELRDIKHLLAEYYARKAHAAMDEFLSETGTDAEEFYQSIATEHVRTPYIPEAQL